MDECSGHHLNVDRRGLVREGGAGSKNKESPDSGGKVIKSGKRDFGACSKVDRKVFCFCGPYKPPFGADIKMDICCALRLGCALFLPFY